MPISNNLKNVRKEKHCYQKDVALATGICPRSISNIERGGNSTPNGKVFQGAGRRTFYPDRGITDIRITEDSLRYFTPSHIV